MHRFLLGISWLVAVGACATPLTYGHDTSAIVCSNQQTCNEEAFDLLYDDVGQCMDAIGPVFGGSCYLDNCDTFNAEAGNACLLELRSATCESPASFQQGDCASVWSDCRGLELAACVATHVLGGD